ncbi:Ribokinase-like protein [Peniophora sp. CONT]|nr:Ribokinase-like protein [Peniophora sp. CONT]
MSKHCLVRGSINIDEFFHVADVVLPGQTISSTGFERRGGGKGANQAAAVARAGAPVRLVGAVGSDGEWLVNDLKTMGVDTSDIQTVEKEPTGRAIIQLTKSGENCIILHKGANYARQDTESEIAGYLSGASHLLVQNEVPLGVTTSALREAGKVGVPSVYNPSPMPADDELRAFPWDCVSYLLVNEGEASALLRAFSGSSASQGTELKPVMPAGQIGEPNLKVLEEAKETLRALIYLPAFSKTTVVCTLGGAGVLAALPSNTSESLYLPAVKLEGTTRDTTGAGDCFTGYFVAGLMALGQKGSLGVRELAPLLRLSTQAAGMCVEKRGAMESIPERRDVEERLAKLPALTFD